MGKSKDKTVIAVVLLVFVVAALASASRNSTLRSTLNGLFMVIEKPVIYLYPPRDTIVDVRLDVDGRITVTDPPLDSTQSWHVLAAPSGNLVDLGSGQRAPYLFWEADMGFALDMSSGTVVKGRDTRVFLRDVLAERGLNSSEAASFIEYWAPRMEPHAYNLVHFEGSGYERAARLHVVPEPDTKIRVFMAYQPLSEWVFVQPQRPPDPPTREGFVLVEWGGTEVPTK